MIEIRLFEAFAGYGSQLMALRRLERKYPGQLKVTPVGFSEIDEYAIKAYKTCHGEGCRNYGDITKINWQEVPDFDLFTYSFPCTNISIAGAQAGMEEGSGTSSSLLWECRKAIIAKRPKYLMLENVKALISKTYRAQFATWLEELESYGYKTFWKLLNANEFNVPQNRERVFAISILRDPNSDIAPSYTFPESMPLTKTEDDYLEQNVDERFFLSEESIKKYYDV